MGMFKKSSWSSYEPPKIIQKQLPNPNPKNYKIIESYAINGNLVIKINYPDCTNFEGVDDTSAGIMCILCCICAGILSIVSIVLVCNHINMIVMGIINPSYGAIQEIISIVKNH